ncbi:alpha/beta-hydrolase [Sarocladium strictum]
MSNPEDAAAAPPGEEVKPYKIHVSTRYLDLTRKKLELTRLPHEKADPRSTDWWEPKPQVEPLIDFWLEQYSWRDHETHLNASVPQFRTSILVPPAQTPARLHFIHAQSPHANAVPLLLIPPFPVTNLSLSHLIQPLIDPDDAAVTQPFHVVIPSLPGLGFSDALANNTPMISTTAAMLDVLMGRLDYPHYIASNTASAAGSPSEIDWQLIRYLSEHYQESCLGCHFISPPLKAPERQDSLLEWLKWLIVSFLSKPMFGYTQEDVSAVQRTQSTRKAGKQETALQQLGLNAQGGKEPNTLAYALCDSPVGMLIFTLMIMRVLGLTKQLSPKETITLAELTWLPGPEGTLRYWAHCGNHVEQKRAPSGRRPKIALTVFPGEDQTSDTEVGKAPELLPLAAPSTYACPAWASLRYEVLASSRVAGDPKLVAWERPEVISAGVRDLSKAILKTDTRMRAAEHPGSALLEQIVVPGGQNLAPAEMSGTTVQVTPGGSTDAAMASPLKKPLTPTTVGDHLAPPTADGRPRTPPVRSSNEASPSPIDTDPAVPPADSNESSPDTVITVRQT